MAFSWKRLKIMREVIRYATALSHIENALLWAEENLREPQINCVAGRGVRNELLDSPRNLQWMRLWTTMSLTHSDGYVIFTMGGAP